jgi:hypothetical protein
MAFRFRLARVLEWYERQYKLEASLLQQSAGRALDSHQALARQRESRLEGENQVLRLDGLQGNDLAAQESWRAQALAREARLLQVCRIAEKELDEQRSATLAAQRRVRLVEKMRDRKRSEFDYQFNKEIEEAAADSHLAGFSRGLWINQEVQGRQKEE